MSYETRIGRAERFEERAEKAQEAALSTHKKAKDMASCIPFGQPILIGHHSEGRDRRFRARIHSTFGKAFALQDYAQSLRRRAEAAASNTTIYGDDPQVLVKLREKLALLEKRHETMKSANTAIRKGDTLALVDLVGPETAAELTRPGRFAGLGYPSYTLTNSNARIRETRKRLEIAESKAKAGPKSYEAHGVQVEEVPSADRIRLFFDGKPAEEVRDILKACGFRWSPREGAWQRNLNNAGRWAATSALEKIGRLSR